MKIKYLGTRKIYQYKNYNIEVSQFQDEFHKEHGFSGFCYYIIIKNRDGDLRDIEEQFECGDFHGGITYCRRITEQSFSNPDPDKRWQQDATYLKIGCDHAHIYDNQRVYTEETILADAQRTIDTLIEAGVLND